MALTAPLQRALLPAVCKAVGLPLSFARASSSTGTSTKPPAATLPEHVSILPMPQLSPLMTDGVLRRLLKKEGDHVLPYDVVAEVETESLTEEAYRVGDFAGTVSLLIEAQDEGYIARALVAEGERVPVGTPVALVCEEEAQVDEVKGMACGVTDVYDPQQQPVNVFTWQSYLSKSKTGQSGGCM